jgi:hypothetical protein
MVAIVSVRFMNGETVYVTKSARTNPEILGTQSTPHGNGNGDSGGVVGKTPGGNGGSIVTGR